MTNLSSNMRFTFHFRQLNATSHTAFSANLDSSDKGQKRGQPIDWFIFGLTLCVPLG